MSLVLLELCDPLEYLLVCLRLQLLVVPAGVPGVEGVEPVVS